MTTLVAETKDEERRADGRLTHAHPLNEREEPPSYAEPIERGCCPGTEPSSLAVATGRRGRQIDYL